MGFLLAKILVLLVLAASCGGLLAWWWFRRHYQDVTLEYTQSRDEWAAWRRDFEERLAARPAVDLEPLTTRFAALEAALQALESSVPDLRPTEKRLMAIEHALFPVQTRLDELESAVRGFHVPPPQALDLTPVLERLATLESRLENPRVPH
jgi:hypothetical protein